MSRLIIVSTRLPVTLTSDESGTQAVPSVGGLATGLRGPHERSRGVWIGWPGQPAPPDAGRREELASFLAEHRAAPVWLSQAEVTRFYESVSNGVIWPLFHYLIDQIPLHVEHWQVYEAVNARFA